MSNWKPTRFWQKTGVCATEGGFSVMLDDKPVRTPAKANFVVPTRALAEAVAAEWAAQKDAVRPETMPLTRTANSAIDRVRPQHGDVARLIAAYGETDLLCHRADAPAELVQRQAEAWDPLLDWAEDHLGARLVAVDGVIPAPQDPHAIEILAGLTQALDPFELAAFHDLVSLTGSLILGFAAIHRRDDPETLWNFSRIDETWQEEQWGIDEEAAIHTAMKKQAFLDSVHIFTLLGRD